MIWAEGIDAVCVNSLYKNPFEHSSGDRASEIDFDLLMRAAKGVLTWAARSSSPNAQ
jgi:hypothetical protein